MPVNRQITVSGYQGGSFTEEYPGNFRDTFSAEIPRASEISARMRTVFLILLTKKAFPSSLGFELTTLNIIIRNAETDFTLKTTYANYCLLSSYSTDYAKGFYFLRLNMSLRYN